MSLLRKGAISRVRPFIDYALSFDGLDDYVSVPHNPSLNFGTGNFTLEIWVKLYSLAAFQELMVKTLDWSTAYEFFFDPFGRFGMSVWDGVHYPIAYTTTVIETDVWYYLVGTREGDYTKVYLNGNFEDDDIDGPLGSPDNIGDFLVGDDLVFPTPLNGTIDEVRIYNRALSLAEIQRNMHAKTPVLDGLVLWFPMREGVGNMAYDKSGKANHGTIYGATWVRR